MKILIADDSLLSRRLLEDTLGKWGYEVVAARDGSQAREILSGPDSPPLAILDWMMPGHTGPELCDLVRRAGAEPYTYILLLTSRNEKQDLVTGMDAGADDYITKPFDRHELQVRLRAGTRIVELQEQLLRTREALREQATRDYLTNLWNRSAILDKLNREMARSSRDGTPFGVVLADLDHFKTINDTWGHAAGDVALKEATARILSSLRPYDSVGRYGGEEFLMVLPGADLEEAAGLADRVREGIAAAPIAWQGASIPLSCSFGVTSGFGDAGVPAAELIRIADEALYSAKHAGRNRVVTAVSELEQVPAH
jgi:two-component system, cell cycle response regulator